MRVFFCASKQGNPDKPFNIVARSRLLFQKRARATNDVNSSVTFIGAVGAHDRTYSRMAAVKVRIARKSPAPPGEPRGAKMKKPGVAGLFRRNIFRPTYFASLAI
jgi:hypothetical protein